jgi:hypothetical protein
MLQLTQPGTSVPEDLIVLKARCLPGGSVA